MFDIRRKRSLRLPDAGCADRSQRCRLGAAYTVQSRLDDAGCGEGYERATACICRLVGVAPGSGIDLRDSGALSYFALIDL